MNSLRKLLLARARTVPSAAVGEVPSPCMSVCRVDAATGWCEGCLRTLDEIAAWGSLDDANRRAVWQEVERRAAT